MKIWQVLFGRDYPVVSKQSKLRILIQLTVELELISAQEYFMVQIILFPGGSFDMQKTSDSFPD